MSGIMLLERNSTKPAQWLLRSISVKSALVQAYAADYICMVRKLSNQTAVVNCQTSKKMSRNPKTWQQAGNIEHLYITINANILKIQTKSPDPTIQASWKSKRKSPNPAIQLSFNPGNKKSITYECSSYYHLLQLTQHIEQAVSWSRPFFIPGSCRQPGPQLSA